MSDQSSTPDPDPRRPSEGQPSPGGYGPPPEGGQPPPPGNQPSPPPGGYGPPPGGHAQPPGGQPPPPPPGGHGPPPQQGYGPPPGGYAPPPGGYGPPPQQGYGPPPGGGYGPPLGYQAPVSRSDERTWAMVAHLVAIVGYFVPGLIVYLVFKDRSAYLSTQGKEALNWGITTAVLELAVVVLAALTFGLLSFLPALTFVLRLVFGIVAGLAVKDHADYRYPFAIRAVR